MAAAPLRKMGAAAPSPLRVSPRITYTVGPRRRPLPAARGPLRTVGRGRPCGPLRRWPPIGDHRRWHAPPSASGVQMPCIASLHPAAVAAPCGHSAPQGRRCVTAPTAQAAPLRSARLAATDPFGSLTAKRNRRARPKRAGLYRNCPEAQRGIVAIAAATPGPELVGRGSALSSQCGASSPLRIGGRKRPPRAPPCSPLGSVVVARAGGLCRSGRGVVHYARSRCTTSPAAYPALFFWPPPPPPLGWVRRVIQEWQRRRRRRNARTRRALRSAHISFRGETIWATNFHAKHPALVYPASGFADEVFHSSSTHPACPASKLHTQAWPPNRQKSRVK